LTKCPNSPWRRRRLGVRRLDAALEGHSNGKGGSLAAALQGASRIFDCRLPNSGFGIQDSAFRDLQLPIAEFRIQDSGFGIQGSAIADCRLSNFAFRISTFQFPFSIFQIVPLCLCVSAVRAVSIFALRVGSGKTQEGRTGFPVDDKRSDCLGIQSAAARICRAI